MIELIDLMIGAFIAQGKNGLVRVSHLIEMLEMIKSLSGISTTNNYTAQSNPTVNSDSTQGYSAGSEWLNRSNADPNQWTMYKCWDATPGAAIWHVILFR